jgi:pimeloyl-ACP methyl ester carboxylesterase
MRFLIFLAVIQIGLPVLMLLARNRLMFFPWSRPTAEAGLKQLTPVTEAELVRIARPDGRLLAAYDVRPKSRAADAAAEDLPTVVFFHGNAGNISIRSSLIGWFAEGVRARVILFDYSGYGGNEGSPSEDEVYSDGLAVVDWLAERGVDPSRVVLYGESLGAAVAAYVAEQRGCAGIVLQSTFPSLSAMAMSAYWFLPLGSVFVTRSFPTADRVASLTCPVLVAHGSDDRIIPISLGRKLHAAAPAGSDFVEVPDAGHNDFFDVAGAAYLEDLATRFRSWTR